MWPWRQYIPQGEAVFRDLESKDHRVRVRALRALAEFEHPSELAWRSLKRALDDAHAEVRSAAACCAADLGHTDAVERLVEMVADADLDVRRTALGALGTLGDRRGLEVIRKSLHSELGELRYVAAIAFAELEGAAGAKVLVPLLSDPEPPVRWAVLAALGDIAAADHCEAISACLQDDDEQVRFEAALSLGRLGDARGLEILGRNATHKERGLTVCEVLGALDDERAVPYLHKVLGRVWTHPIIKMGAAAALVRLGDREAYVYLVKKARSRRRFVREAAADMLSNLPPLTDRHAVASEGGG